MDDPTNHGDHRGAEAARPVYASRWSPPSTTRSSARSPACIRSGPRRRRDRSDLIPDERGGRTARASTSRTSGRTRKRTPSSEQLLSAAIERRASDIHIETLSNHLQIRFRIDGVLEEAQLGELQTSCNQMRERDRVSIEDSRQARYCRTSTAAGREFSGPRRSARASRPTSTCGSRSSRATTAKAWCCASWIRKGFPTRSISSAVGRRDGEAAAAAASAERHHARDRSDRLGEKHHAVRLSDDALPPRNQDSHRRGSGRIRLRAVLPVRGQRADRQYVCGVPARLPSARSGSHHGRRDPRRGDGRDGLPRRADRAPAAQHAAHQYRRGRGDAPARSQDRSEHALVIPDRGHRTTAGARSLHLVQGAVPALGRVDARVLRRGAGRACIFYKGRGCDDCH